MRALALALALASAGPAAAQPQRHPQATLEVAGSVEEALTLFKAVCAAHPGEIGAQRVAALGATPPMKQLPSGAPGVESFVSWPVQVSLFEGADGPSCVAYSPLTVAPKIDEEAHKVVAALSLGAPQPDGGARVWHLVRGGRRQTIVFSITDQANAAGDVHPTVQLVLIAAKR